MPRHEHLHTLDQMLKEIQESRKLVARIVKQLDDREEELRVIKEQFKNNK